MIFKSRDRNFIPLRDKHSGGRGNALLGADGFQRPDCEDRVQPLAFMKDTIEILHLGKRSLVPLVPVFG